MYANGEVMERPLVMTYSKEKEITESVVWKFIEKHQVEKKRYQYLAKAYRGDMEIFDYPRKEKHKPDNRVAVAFPKYIVDTFVGYFNGIPIKKHIQDDQLNELLQDFDDINDMEDEEHELAKLACIYGRAYELMYQDEDAVTNVVYNSPEDLFIVYDDTIKQEPLFAVRYGYEKSLLEGVNGKLVGTLYTKEYQITLSGSGTTVQFGEMTPNVYDGLPVNEFFLNDERMGIFEIVMPLINGYNKALSEKANDVDYFSDQYLLFLGAKVDANKLNKVIRDNRVINYYGGDMGNVDVRFLEKPNSDTQTENLLNRLEDMIFAMSMVANITDESFGNASGTSLAYKLQSMSNMALSFERKYQSSLNRRYKLFFSLSTNIPEQSKNEWRSIEYKFTRNAPKNLLEEAQTAAQLMSVTSEETALSVLSIIPDVQNEVKAIEEERKTKSIMQPLFDDDQQDTNKEANSKDTNNTIATNKANRK